MIHQSTATTIKDRRGLCGLVGCSLPMCRTFQGGLLQPWCPSWCCEKVRSLWRMSGWGLNTKLHRGDMKRGLWRHLRHYYYDSTQHQNGPNTKFDPKKTESSKCKGTMLIIGSSQISWDRILNQSTMYHSSRKIDETVETNIAFRIKNTKGDPSYRIVRTYGRKGI